MNQNKVTFTLIVSLLVTLFFVTSASASTMNDEYIMEINIDENNLNIADHSGSGIEGNWISLSGGSAFTLPYPLSFTYNGVNYTETTINGREMNVSLNVDNFTDYVIDYPYATHQMYTNVSGLNEVEIEFHGSNYFANKEVDVYLLNSTVSDISQIMSDLLNGDISSLGEMKDSAESEPVTLDNNGDASITYRPLNAGSYCVLMILADDTTFENVLLSATAFEVLDYESKVKVTSEQGNVTLDVQLVDAPDISYTYGAILVKESQYKADVRVEFDGTKEGFDGFVNGVAVIDGFDIVDMGLNDMHKGDISDRLTMIYGAGNITFASNTTPSSTASLMINTTSLSSGQYILFTGVMSDQGLVAFDEIEGSIKNGQFQLPRPKKKSSGGGGGGGSSGESYENIIVKNVLSKTILKDHDVEYSFDDEQNPIRFVKFTPLSNAGRMKSVVEVLKGTSGLVDSEPYGLVYRNVNIAVGTGWANERTISDGVIGFAVEKEWLVSNNVDASSIRLLHYTTEWMELDTAIISEDDDLVYFIAETTSFSPFAIVSVPDEVDVITETPPEDAPVEIISPDETELPVNYEIPEEAIFLALLIIPIALIGIVVKRNELKRNK